MQRSSTLAGDLVARLLDRNPDTRIAAAAALEHPWVKVCVCVRAHVCVCVMMMMMMMMMMMIR